MSPKSNVLTLQKEKYDSIGNTQKKKRNNCSQ